MARTKADVAVHESSGNVFADLGFKDADERLTKVKLAVRLNQVLKQRKLSQLAAAKRLGINQPKVSALSNYKLAGFSVERLIAFLTALDFDVDIVIRTKSDKKKPGRVNVVAA
jgi:predicted XRE-type DNA-binding protein